MVECDAYWIDARILISLSAFCFSFSLRVAIFTYYEAWFKAFSHESGSLTFLSAYSLLSERRLTLKTWLKAPSPSGS
jgi:hypothetical protein